MAIAKKCDRCGRLYENYEGFSVVEGGSKYDRFELRHHWASVSHNYDVCPECMVSLIEWIKGTDNEQ